MVKKMLEVVVNCLYPALTPVKTDWLLLCPPDSVLFASSRPEPRSRSLLTETGQDAAERPRPFRPCRPQAPPHHGGRSAVRWGDCH